MGQDKKKSPNPRDQGAERIATEEARKRQKKSMSQERDDMVPDPNRKLGKRHD
jgi:hypothetical protein